MPWLWSELSPSLLQGAELTAGDALQAAPCARCGTVQRAAGVLRNCQQRPEQGAHLHPRGKRGLPASAKCVPAAVPSVGQLLFPPLSCLSMTSSDLPLPKLR